MAVNRIIDAAGTAAGATVTQVVDTGAADTLTIVARILDATAAGDLGFLSVEPRIDGANLAPLPAMRAGSITLSGSTARVVGQYDVRGIPNVAVLVGVAAGAATPRHVSAHAFTE